MARDDTHVRVLRRRILRERREREREGERPYCARKRKYVGIERGKRRYSARISTGIFAFLSRSASLSSLRLSFTEYEIPALHVPPALPLQPLTLSIPSPSSSASDVRERRFLKPEDFY